MFTDNKLPAFQASISKPLAFNTEPSWWQGFDSEIADWQIYASGMVELKFKRCRESPFCGKIIVLSSGKILIRGTLANLSEYTPDLRFVANL